MDEFIKYFIYLSIYSLIFTIFILGNFKYLKKKYLNLLLNFFLKILKIPILRFFPIITYFYIQYYNKSYLINNYLTLFYLISNFFLILIFIFNFFQNNKEKEIFYNNLFNISITKSTKLLFLIFYLISFIYYFYFSYLNINILIKNLILIKKKFNWTNNSFKNSILLLGRLSKINQKIFFLILIEFLISFWNLISFINIL